MCLSTRLIDFYSAHRCQPPTDRCSRSLDHWLHQILCRWCLVGNCYHYGGVCGQPCVGLGSKVPNMFHGSLRPCTATLLEYCLTAWLDASLHDRLPGLHSLCPSAAAQNACLYPTSACSEYTIKQGSNAPAQSRSLAHLCVSRHLEYVCLLYEVPRRR
jgi:hypothetical protein